MQTLSSNNPGLNWPLATQWFLLDKVRHSPDAVVVSSGSNAIVVYRTTAVGHGQLTFARRKHFRRHQTNELTVADVNGDSVPDMIVANQNSNDVSVLFGAYDAHGNWMGEVGRD